MVSSSGASAVEAKPITGVDSARYTRDMLENLKGIALRQDQIVLARLLEAASREAERIVREGAS